MNRRERDLEREHADTIASWIFYFLLVGVLLLAVRTC